MRTRALRRGLLAALLGLCALVAPGTLAAGAEGPPDATHLEVMTFNIEYGGTLVDFDKVVAAIEAADPDIVGIEEGESSVPRLAKALGWAHWNRSMQIISRYPILEPPGADSAYALVEVRPDRVVALSNIHLPSDPYGPYWVRDGKPVGKVLALERRLRLPALERQLELLPALAAEGMPVFLVGDFNAPSHLDWTEAAVGTRPYLRYAVEWPVSVALANAGFRDTYREAHPDPIADPGITWWAARPKVVDWAGNPTRKDPRDRIDYVYAAGPAQTISSELVGERGGRGVTLSVSPWPSDHRAVMSTFDVTPATMPVLVAVDHPVVTAGTDLHVTFHAPGEAGETVAVVPAGGDPAAEAIWSSPTGPPGTTGGTLAVPTASLPPGGYEAALLAPGGAVLSRIPFWLKAKGARTQVSTGKARYRVGEPIEVTWTNAPANRWDWLGVYRAPADPANDPYLIWQYTGGASSGTGAGKPAGSLVMDGESTYGKPWPLPPGRYDVLYLVSDTYRGIARASFRVVR
jgi:endonuclease/exonuclease/phosphatase family metal-dependent hydrolase